MGPSPPTRARGPGFPRPSPACCQARCHCPFLAPSSPETQSVLCLSAHSAARSHQLVCVPSHPGAPAAALHTKETWARAASPPRAPERPQPSPGAPGGAGTREDPLRTPPAGTRPCSRLGCRGSGTARPRGARGSAPTQGPPPRGLLSPRLQKRRPGEPALGDTRTGNAAAGISRRRRRRRRPSPGSRAPPAGRPDSGALPAPRAPARAAPARSSRAPPPPPPPGPHRLLRPSGCRTLPDRAPNPAAQSPSLLFGPPSPTKRRPDWRDARRALVQSQGPPGSEAPSQPHAEAPAGLGRAGRAGGACARARAGAEGRGRGVEVPRRFFVLSLNARRLSGRRRAGGRGRGASGARAAGGGWAGWGGGNRPEGGTARSRRLAGTVASEFPGRRGGAGPKAKFEQFKTRGW